LPQHLLARSHRAILAKLAVRWQKKLYTLLSIEKASRIQYVYEQKMRQPSRIQSVYFLSIEFSGHIQFVFLKKTRKVSAYTYCILLCQRVFDSYTMCIRPKNSTNQNVYNFCCFVFSRLLVYTCKTLDYPLLLARKVKACSP